jgi:hypothetical protein
VGRIDDLLPGQENSKEPFDSSELEGYSGRQIVLEGETGEEIFEDYENLFTKNKEKKYWNEEQEEAVEQYLRMSTVWLENKKKWELERAEEAQDEPDWDLILELEDLIDESNSPEVANKRERLFRDKIDQPLKKLVENIVFTYKLIRTDIDVKSLQWDCLGFVIEKFANFKPSKGKKSFSYYGTIIKHYLINEKKIKDEYQLSNLDYEVFSEEVNTIKKYELSDKDPLEESSKLFNYIISEIKRELSNTNMSDNDRIVGNAIVNIFETHEDVQVYSKNNLYQMIKEYTNLQTKDITYSLSRFKTLYKITKENFIKKNG